MMKITIYTLLFFVFHNSFAIVQDSVATMQKNGQTVILYEVEAKETMYSIARKYNIPPKSILALNPELINQSVKVGQKIFVPHETARTKPVVNETQFAKQNKESALYHTVERGQTLFAISKLYGTPVYSIKKWNNLNSNDVRVGSKIIIGFENGNDESQITDNQSQNSASAITKVKTKSNTGYDKMIEKGSFGEFAPKSDLAEFYLIKHQDLPIGTMVKVVNEATGAYVFARVSEKNEIKNNKILVSNKVAEKLALSSGTLISIEYNP